MKNTRPFHIVFHVLKVHLINICKIEPPDLLFLFIFISFYIIRYHFSQIFRTSFNIISIKDCHHKLYFLTDSLVPHDIGDNVLEETVCRAISLTGHEVTPDDLHTCH